MRHWGKSEKYALMFNKLGYTLKSNDKVAIIFENEEGFVSIYKRSKVVSMSRVEADKLAAVIEAVNQYMDQIEIEPDDTVNSI